MITATNPGFVTGIIDFAVANRRFGGQIMPKMF